MPDCDHIYDGRSIEDLVYDPVLTNPDSPEIESAPQLAAGRRPWISREGLDPRKDSRDQARI